MKWFLSLLFVLHPCWANCYSPDANALEEFIEDALQTTVSPNFLLICVSRGALKIEPRIHFDKKSYRRGCGVIGHCWALLVEQGELAWIGGHSGETLDYPPRYLDGYARLAHHGSLEDLDRSEEQLPARNPISYLHHQREDGFFQEGDGGYQADYALLIPLSFALVQRAHQVKKQYCFQKYTLFTHQCCHFVMELLGACGVRLDPIHREVEPVLRMGKVTLPLWTDSEFSRIDFMSPDALLAKMKILHQQGWGVDMTSLYRKHQRKTSSKKVDKRVLGLLGL